MHALARGQGNKEQHRCAWFRQFPRFYSVFWMESLTASAAPRLSGHGERNLAACSELFAGPSLIGVPTPLLASFHQISGPIAAGDLDRRLTQSKTPRVVCIADGYLESGIAISNDEIRRVLSAGWPVWGVSSVGALKAVELANEGMKGFGLVYRLLRRFRNVSASDISILHYPFPPYEPVTISLIEIYLLLRTAYRADPSRDWDVRAVMEKLRSAPPSDRTYCSIQSYTPKHLRLHLDLIHATPMRWRAKRRDLAAFCKRMPWLCKT